MKRFALCVLLAALAPGCGNRLAPKPPDSAQGQGETSAATEGAPAPLEGRAQGVDLRLFEPEPTPGGTRKPTFWLHTDTFTMSDAKTWSFENAHAVVYGEEGENADIEFEAGRGHLEEDKMAYLKDGVKAKIGDIALELQDIEWVNADRVARTDNPVSITMDGSNLKSAGLRIFPDQKKLVLNDVAGTIRFERNQP